MKRKHWLGAVLICVLMLFIGSCARESKKTEEVIAEPEIIAEAEDEIPNAEDGMFIFQDVEENSYEAELLENIPKCEYDYSNLTDVDGIKSYSDKENGITSKLGIDVSEFQGEIDWQQVKEFGIEFVIIRLGYRAYGETGELVLDAGFEQNIQSAADAGLEVGVYFFSQAISDEEAKEEAEFVLEQIKNYDVSGPVVFDTEEIKDDAARTDVNTVEQFTSNCITFCDTVREAGYDPMIYSNMKWMAFSLDLEQLTEYAFWYADYHEEPQCPYDFEMWQYTEIGVVPGIESNVDLNLWFIEE